MVKANSAWNELLLSEGVSLSEGVNYKTHSSSDEYFRILHKIPKISQYIPLNEVGRVEGDTLNYKGYPVSAYIRRGRKKGYLPTYHFTYCQKIREIPKSKFFCTNQASSYFDVDYEDDNGNLIDTRSEKLSACGYCVSNYLGLSSYNDKERRAEIAQSLTPKDIMHDLCILLNNTAWQSNLTKHSDKKWQEISFEVRDRSNWTCDECGVYVGEENKVFLHAHHRNHDRNDNHRTNLQALCIKCHSDKHRHESLKKSLIYKEFCNRYESFKRIS